MTAQANKPPAKNKHPKKHITPQKSQALLAMRSAGMTYQEIADEANLCKAGVWQHLKRITPEHTEYQQLKSNLPDQFVKLALDNANLSARLTKHLTNMTDEQLGSLSPVNIAAVKRTADIGAGIMHDHYRLEAGLSTSNLATISADLAALQDLDAAHKRGKR